MLLPDNIAPINSIFYNGAWVLEKLLVKPKQDLFDLYQNVRKDHEMSFPIFILCLDWLYLLGTAKLDKGNEVELCF